MQGFEERHQRGGLRRAEVLAVRGHVAAALNHLPNQLVLREPYRHAVESRASLPAAICQCMTVAALLRLKNQRALPLQCGGAMQESRRNRGAAPGIHLWTPRRVLR